MLKTLTLASIYESQGHIRDALEIYWEILEKEPNNEAALKAIDRLGRVRKVFKNNHKKETEFFIKMDKKEQFLKFEKWLAKSWN